ncbi:Zn(II)2Cys6 transcription factor [Aspergillus vadensis CBS 113365]|uniref:Zn(II)2Cys6 transcription factor n=1 Tax=Aspergillus vadensis (strain CBS 113365 / IMI 142717 / IBT 24658) TaxID=1448311 RepID=A0A319B100_ASPVC|nr:Zn(II)2Cys6 transcription factor [Aspergillus vadensis CBS 113365]PYH63860.1 Zn(II)2Cys6 transcription factor [Aspergillus vadensis CBS 113365]
MKRSRLHFESNGDASSAASPQSTRPQYTPENDSQQSPRHVPKISRRIRACTECKRHKVRCDMNAGETVCHRCRRMGLECVVNKSLQTLLDDETEWKATIELAMADLLRKAQLPDLSYYQSNGKASEPLSKKRDRQDSTVSTEGTPLGTDHDVGAERLESSTQRVAPEPRSSETTFQQPSQYALDREENGTSSLVTAPMGSLYEVTQLSDIQTTSPGRHHAPDRALVTDFVSRGVVDLHEAEELFSYFDQVLSRYLWDGILLDHKDLTSVRNSSSMLSAAILAVTALHLPKKERTFDICYTEFARLASESMLDRHHTLDDLRALCIGAFWLADVSWKLSGYAVRIATERNLHQSYRKATQGSPEHIEQARLWYLLYTLEHHFSIAYGRPPIIHEDQSIKNHNTFTHAPNVQQGDLRLHSQVDLFIILTRIYHAFGPDVDLEVPDSEFSTIDKYDADLDNWRIAWYPRLAVGSRYVGAYPYRAVNLHYHFSRLQLNSVALRTYHSSISTRPMSAERKKRANIAIQSAIDTLRVVLDEPDIQRALVGVPLYLHSMITFAAVFLLKIAAKGCSSSIPNNQGQQNSISSAGLHIDVAYVRELVGRIVNMMVSCSKRASEHHLSHHIARGLRKMLTGLEEWEKRNLGNSQSLTQSSHDALPMFKPVVIPGAQPLGERDTILNPPPPLLGVAPLSAERGNSFDSDATQVKAQTGLSEGSVDPMMADLWGFDEDYFPTGVFDFLQSQMPA